MSACGINWHTHDPGVVLTHLAVAIADGADCLADMASCVNSPNCRSGGIDRHGVAGRRGNGGRRAPSHPRGHRGCPGGGVGSCSPGDSLVLDFDATLVNSYSEKQDATPTYKKGFGFFPIGVWCDTTNEPLAASCVGGTPGPTTPTTMSPSSTGRCRDCPRSTRRATSMTTTRPWLSTRSWSVPTRPVPPTGSWTPSWPPTVTSPSDSPSTREYVTPWSSSRKRTGSKPERPTARSATVPGWSS